MCRRLLVVCVTYQLFQRGMTIRSQRSLLSAFSPRLTTARGPSHPDRDEAEVAAQRVAASPRKADVETFPRPLEGHQQHSSHCPVAGSSMWWTLQYSGG